ncbi:MAG: lysine biosynthesis protein LysW [Patescibacteria group bacterium]
MKSLTCPECKNEVDLSTYGNITKGQIIECNHCGITLELTNVESNELQAEIADEGK